MHVSPSEVQPATDIDVADPMPPVSTLLPESGTIFQNSRLRINLPMYSCSIEPAEVSEACQVGLVLQAVTDFEELKHQIGLFPNIRPLMQPESTSQYPSSRT